MLKAYLDANLLIAHRLSNHIYHQKAKDLLKRLAKDVFYFYISPLTLDEFWYGLIFITRSLRANYKNKDSSFFFRFIEQADKQLFSLANLRLANAFFTYEVINKTASYIRYYNLKPRDAFHLTYCVENQIDVLATFDEDFKKLEEISDLKVISKASDLDKFGLASETAEDSRD